MTDQHSLHNPLLGTVTIAQPTAEVWQRAELDLEHPVARREAQFATGEYVPVGRIHIKVCQQGAVTSFLRDVVSHCKRRRCVYLSFCYVVF